MLRKAWRYYVGAAVLGQLVHLWVLWSDPVGFELVKALIPVTLNVKAREHNSNYSKYQDVDCWFPTVTLIFASEMWLINVTSWIQTDHSKCHVAISRWAAVRWLTILRLISSLHVSSDCPCGVAVNVPPPPSKPGHARRINGLDVAAVRRGQGTRVVWRDTEIPSAALLVIMWKMEKKGGKKVLYMTLPERCNSKHGSAT